MKKIIQTFIIVTVFVTACGVQSKLKSTPEFSRANYLEGHYLYEDNLIVLSARLKPTPTAGSFNYDLLVINKGPTAMPLSYYNDILTMNYQDRIYSLHKITRLADYPAILNPGGSTLVIFQLDGIFSRVVYDIPELIFKMGEKRYPLERNPDVPWEVKQTLF